MKRYYLLLGLLGIGILIAGCVSPSTPTSSRIPSTIDDLASMELDPPNDYVDRLMEVIDGGGDPYVRERAVFILTRIALTRNETNDILPLLKDLAMHTRTDEIRTAAYANLALINTLVPPPAAGYLNLTVEGAIRRGSTIRLVAEVTSTVPVTEGVVGIRRLPEEMDLQVDPLVRLALQPHQPQMVEFPMTPQRTGTYLVPVSLVLSLDRVESFERTVDVMITVGETGGNYSVREWGGTSTGGE